MHTHHFAGAQLSYDDALTDRHLLVSFAESKQRSLIDRIDWPHKSIILDSGAFSVWASQASKKPRPPIDLDEYLRFVETRLSKLKAFVALDVIPGRPGVPQTEDEIKRAMEGSIRNLGYMEARGFTPMPVFHEPDPPELLAWMVKKGYPLIGVAGTFNRGKPALLPWLEGIFRAYPKQRFHGLAMTQPAILMDHARFPFASVDSITWLNFQKYGPAKNYYLLGRARSETIAAFGLNLASGKDAVCAYINAQPVSFRRRLGVACIEDMLRS